MSRGVRAEDMENLIGCGVAFFAIVTFGARPGLFILGATLGYCGRGGDGPSSQGQRAGRRAEGRGRRRSGRQVFSVRGPPCSQEGGIWSGLPQLLPWWCVRQTVEKCQNPTSRL
jgi:hypothetical protein